MEIVLKAKVIFERYKSKRHSFSLFVRGIKIVFGKNISILKIKEHNYNIKIFVKILKLKKKSLSLSNDKKKILCKNYYKI